MWRKIGRRTNEHDVAPVSKNELTVHHVSSGKHKYYRLCFPRMLASGANMVQFALDQSNNSIALVAVPSNLSDSFQVSLDRRVNKRYVTFKAGSVPSLKPGKYFASIPWFGSEGPVKDGERVLFYLHQSR